MDKTLCCLQIIGSLWTACTHLLFIICIDGQVQTASLQLRPHKSFFLSTVWATVFIMCVFSVLMFLAVRRDASSGNSSYLSSVRFSAFLCIGCSEIFLQFPVFSVVSVGKYWKSILRRQTTAKFHLLSNLKFITWGVHVLRSPNFFLGNGSR